MREIEPWLSLDPIKRGSLMKVFPLSEFGGNDPVVINFKDSIIV